MDAQNVDGQNDFPGSAAGAPPVSRPQGTGRTSISETAVAKVAAIAARSVHGVHALGSGAARSLGAIRDVVGVSDLAQGVRAEVGETQVAVDVNLIAEYGMPLQLVADGVRAAVYAAVEGLVGLTVIEVNVEINDVHISGAESDRAAPRRSERAGVHASHPFVPDLGHRSPGEDTARTGIEGQP
ncbi:Asp23/Gls24 family envelope stress response protein [Arthrobacter sp. A5]|uniref:Asp23/Gls24 family envelope stress response protein n=1 Tax=Arthrobacter sp. A5 TaxID=576926 RepID=UPI003DA7D06C